MLHLINGAQFHVGVRVFPPFYHSITTLLPLYHHQEMASTGTVLRVHKSHANGTNQGSKQKGAGGGAGAGWTPHKLVPLQLKATPASSTEKITFYITVRQIEFCWPYRLDFFWVSECSWSQWKKTETHNACIFFNHLFLFGLFS